MTERRVGLLGGSFNPVHAAHIALARSARQALGLDTVFFIPAAAPPHKSPADLAPFEHRVNMLRLALAEDECLLISDIEKRLPQPTYSVDMLTAFRTENPTLTSLFFLCGADSFLQIRIWKEYRRLLAGIDFVIAFRAGFDNSELTRQLIGLGYVETDGVWCSGEGVSRVYLLERLLPPVSSTEVRRKIRAGEPTDGELTPQVRDYIDQQYLYQVS